MRGKNGPRLLLITYHSSLITSLNCLAPVEGFGAYAEDGDVAEARPGADLRVADGGRDRRVAPGDELHRALGLFGRIQSLGAARQHHAAPAQGVLNLLDLE